MFLCTNTFAEKHTFYFDLNARKIYKEKAFMHIFSNSQTNKKNTAKMIGREKR